MKNPVLVRCFLFLGIAAAVPVSRALSAEVEKPALVRQLGDAPYSGRSEILAHLQDYLEASDDRLDELEKSAAGMDIKTRAAFDDLVKQIDARAENLTEAIEAARSVEADGWPAARTNLSTQFSAHAEALAKAEQSVAQGVPKGNL